MYWRNIVFGAGLWILGIPILAKLAVHDPHFKGVILRSTRYMQIWLPAAGKPGARVRPARHKRWD
jgi:type IV secretory pathway TrbD component